MAVGYVNYLYHLFSLLRPKQWIKNLFVFAPIIFSGHFFLLVELSKVSLAFGLFCLLSSACYALNDALDVERDKIHPIKKNRPVASGQISRKTAFSITGVLVLVVLLAGFRFDQRLALLMLAYFLLNIAYSLWLKHLMIVDLISIGVSFLLRAYAGGVIINLQLTSWIVVTLFMLALFLGAGKRKGDFTTAQRQEMKGKSFLTTQYPLQFLESLIFFSLILVNVAYLLYTISRPRPFLFSYIFVFYGTLRYLYLLQNSVTYSDPTDIVLKDHTLVFVIVTWVAYMMAATYLRSS